MANIDGTAGSVHSTLAAGVVDVVTLGGDVERLEVVNHGATALTDRIYVTVDGPVPVVKGAGTKVVTPGGALQIESPSGRQTVVRLISAGSPEYSVCGL